MSRSVTTKKPIDLRRERATALGEFVRLATTALKKQPKLRSVVLHSRQSVMDEMGDAIVGPEDVFASSVSRWITR